MASLTDAPTIVLAGVTLAHGWDLTRRAVLAGLKITWGRESHLDPAVPAQLQMSVIDTDGHLASHTHLTRQPITITRGDGRVIFRGRVDDYEFEHLWVTDPANGLERRVWVLNLTASDKLAELANFTPLGPVADMPNVGEHVWNMQPPTTYTPSGGDPVPGRVQDLLAAGVGDIVAGFTWANPYSGLALLRTRTMEDGLSALDHLEGLAQTHPLGYVRYQPHTNRVEVGRPHQAQGLRLTWDGAELNLALPGGRVHPAREVQVPDGYRASTGLSEALNTVQVVQPVAIQDGGLEAQYGTSVLERVVPAAPPGRREFRVVNDILKGTVIETIVRFGWPFSLNDVTSEFGWRSGTNSFHEGIDFSYGGIGGADIHPIGAGTVTTNAYSSGWGNYVIVFHGTVDGNDLYSLYAHMVNPSPVAVGTEVTDTAVLGQVGNTGNSFGEHLHLETHVTSVGGALQWNTGSQAGPRTAIDPRTFMDTYAEFDYGQNLGEGHVWQAQLADATVDMIEQLNGKVKLPTIRFDFRRTTYPAGADLIDTVAHDVAWYFPGSVFNVVLDAATVHQVIGGTLAYDGGWIVDAYVAPALGVGEGLRIDELVTIDAPLLDDFDPDITVADLGNVTQGVTA